MLVLVLKACSFSEKTISIFKECNYKILINYFLSELNFQRKEEKKEITLKFKNTYNFNKAFKIILNFEK